MPISTHGPCQNFLSLLQTGFRQVCPNLYKLQFFLSKKIYQPNLLGPSSRISLRFCTQTILKTYLMAIHQDLIQVSFQRADLEPTSWFPLGSPTTNSKETFKWDQFTTLKGGIRSPTTFQSTSRVSRLRKQNYSFFGFLCFSIFTSSLFLLLLFQKLHSTYSVLFQFISTRLTLVLFSEYLSLC